MIENRIESLRFSPVENVTTGTIATLSPHDTSMIFFTGAGAVTVESISYGAKGKVLKLANLTGSTLTLKHNTGSINKNRIITSDATDLVIQNNQIVSLLYDHVNSRWKIDGAASGGGGGGGTERQFIYRPSEVSPTGNVYNDLALLLTAAQAVNGKKLILVDITAHQVVPAATYNFVDCTIIYANPVSNSEQYELQFAAFTSFSGLPDAIGVAIRIQGTLPHIFTTTQPVTNIRFIKYGKIIKAGAAAFIRANTAGHVVNIYVSGIGADIVNAQALTGVILLQNGATANFYVDSLSTNALMTPNLFGGNAGNTVNLYGLNGKVRTSAASNSAFSGTVNQTTSEFRSRFTNLADAPSVYTLGDALKVVRVNAGATGLEFYTPSGSGSPYFDDDGGTPTTAPSAGATDSIAIGESASVLSGAINSFAIGTSSFVGSGSTNSIVIGTGARVSYNSNLSNISIGHDAKTGPRFFGTGDNNNIAIGRYASAESSYGGLTGSIAIGNSASVYEANNAISIGSDSQAVGISSLSIGRFSTSSNYYSVAIGSGNSSGDSALSSGANCIAIGRGTDATTPGSIAIGRNAQATTNIYSIAIGSGSTTSLAANATGNRSVAIGFGSDATGSGSSAFGRYSQATGPYSIALGGGYSTGATSSGITTIAIGQLSSASGNRSICIGLSSSSVPAESIAIGRASQNRHSYSTACISIGDTARTGHTSFWASNAIAIGTNSKAYSSSANISAPIAIGATSNASGTLSISIGVSSSASGSSSISIGNSATNSADNCLAIGVTARGRIAMTSQIQGISINRKDEVSVVASDVFRDFASNEAIVMTKEIDLKTATTTTITVPTGSRFYPNEVGLILTTLTGTITLQPDISFGITGTNNKFVTQTTSSLNAVYDRDVYTALTTAGESSLTFTVNVAATGSAAISGRAYFKGMLVEIQ